jgi:tetratricopeptide (TPR) repeat protein
MKTIVWSIFISSFVHWAAAQSIEEARTAIDREDYRKAESILNALIAKSPKKPEPYYWLGYSALQQAEEAEEDNDKAQMNRLLEEANDWFSKGIAAGSKFPFNFAGQGYYLLKSKRDFDGAKKLFTQALEISPDDIALQTFIANAYNKNNDVGNSIEEATFLLTKLSAKNDKDPAVLTALGNNYLKKGIAEVAIANFEKALQQPGGNTAQTHYCLGEAYLINKQKNEAAKAFNKALEVDPNYGMAYRKLGKLYFDIRKYKEAKELYQKYVQLSPKDIRARLLYINALYYAEDYANGVVEIQAALKDTQVITLYKWLAICTYETAAKDSAKNIPAREAMEKFMQAEQPEKIQPKDHAYYGKILLAVKKCTEAAAAIEKAVGTDPKLADNEKKLNKLYEDLANAYECAGQMDKYVDAWRRAYDLRNKDLATAYFYGFALKRTKNYDKAVEIFNKAIEIKNDFPEAYYELAGCKVYLDQSDSLGEAKPFYEKFIQLTAPKADKFKDKIWAANRYLCLHYYKRKDNAKSKEYGDKAMATKEDATIKQILDYINKGGK